MKEKTHKIKLKEETNSIKINQICEVLLHGNKQNVEQVRKL